MNPGYISLALHAHLPFVRHPEHEIFLEENWLFEAISETYLPLLRMFNRLILHPSIKETFSAASKIYKNAGTWK